MAAPAGQPQARMFGPGFGLSLKGLVGLGRYLDAQAGITYVGLPPRADAPTRQTGGAWGYGGGLRLKRPHDLPGAYSPWLDGDLMYVRTGALNRFGYSIGGGVAMALDVDRRFWLGPFIRYEQIVQVAKAGNNSADAKIFIVGASLEFGSAHRRPPSVVVECGATPIASLSDRDGDGLADAADLCPDVAGTKANYGCPVYQKLTVKRNKLVLNEKILFAWDKADIEQQSHPLLDEVVIALRDNKSFRVRIEGHTDSTGPETHNQTLSEERARAVLDYLAKHGIAADRLAYVGFSSSEPLDRNDTETGREANRRVEFVVELAIVKDGSVK